MEDCILSGCDVHEKTLELFAGKNAEEPERRGFAATPAGREKLMAFLKGRAKELGASRIVMAYEAGPFGYGLYDDATAAGVECYVLAPTRIERSLRDRKNKTDKKDARRILEVLRGHVLAGNDLPSVWVPDEGTREDREIVRQRLELGRTCGGVRTKIGSLLRRWDVWKPKGMGNNWTQSHRRWLVGLTGSGSVLGEWARKVLASLLRQMGFYEEELRRADKEMLCLASRDRYRELVEELCRLKGVGELTAMVFLTEMGDLSRFKNRRQIGSYIGIAPSSHESGEDSDRKGHITRQGSSRLRHVLCQASWVRVRCDAKEQAWYAQAAERNPKHKKIALVGSMRRLAIVMWHRALEAQEERGKAPPNLPSPNGAAGGPKGKG